MDDRENHDLADPSDPADSTSQPLPADDTPEIYAVTRADTGFKYNRRAFLGVTGAAAAGVIVTNVGETVAGDLNLAATRTPRPTATPRPIPCTVRAKTGELVNIYVGPGRHRGIRDYLPENEDFPVLGKALDPNDKKTYWWKIGVEGIDEAWVHPDDVTTSGDCKQIKDTAAPDFVPAATARPTDQPTPTVQPGVPGTVPQGQTGINYTDTSGRTYTLPCGSPIPAGAVCVCNCVTVPAACSCDGYRACSCAGASHYWYPN